MSEPVSRCCDLVMKGGVTSGVLYPSAVVEIAKKFHLVGIGGTSAGAIAACGAAAAEYRRRQTGSSSGFESLIDYARQLSEPGNLKRLFQSDPDTEKLFLILEEIVASGKFTLLNSAKLYFGRKKYSSLIQANGYGICTGMGGAYSSKGEPALTEWLADLIDKVGGNAGERPLTFRDLHSASIPACITEKMRGLEQRSIDLRLVTTNVTLGRPYELPFFDESDNIFFFDPKEWSRFFPQRIIEHLIYEASLLEEEVIEIDGKLPLPREGLPIVVAARMSLSFPLLFTMIPLWARNPDEVGAPLERVWFSDGGITSNFPIHRFDSLYPRWPTLGLNLQYTGKSNLVQRKRLREALAGGSKTMVFVPQDDQEGRLGPWNRFDSDDNRLIDLLGFGAAIFRSAQTWHDNAYLRLPGYRDRVAEIWLSSSEGGLNLDMEKNTIEDLIRRGVEAGRMLAEKFADQPPDSILSWEAHRWARFRSGMAGMIESLLEFKRSAYDDAEGGEALEALLATLDAPPSYRFETEDQRKSAEQVARKLLLFAGEVEEIARLINDDPRKIKFGPFYGGPLPPVEVGTRAPI